MSYLIDTCAFLWSLGNSSELSDGVKRLVEQGDDLFLSQVTLWEIAIKKTIGKLELEESTEQLVEYCEDAEICILPIENRYFDTIQKIPYIHGDPFDRLIIATALDGDYTIITRDRIFSQYPDVRVFW